jgi:predicted nucleic acid-binding protein
LRSVVLDSYAILAFLFGEAGHDRVGTLFERAAESDKTLLIAAPNWAEVRYMIERKVGAAQWREVHAKLMSLPLQVVPADRDLAEMAGELKATKKMSLADCFAAALAKQRNADIYTGDPEFHTVESEIRISWL